MSNPQELVEDIVVADTAQPAQVETQEIEVVEHAEQEAQPASEQQKKPFDPKTDKVEFSTPEQQEKFNYMYKQVKMSDARNQMLNDLLQTQQKRLDEVEGRFKQTDSADAERILFSKIKSARDAGDDAAEISAINDLVEFKADKKITEKIAPKPQYAPQIAPEALKYTEDFVRAIDVNGQPLRPYLNETSPDFDTAISTLNEIAQKYVGDPYAVPKSLAELEQVMRPKMTQNKPPVTPQTRAPNPMQGGNLTNVPQRTTIKMTRQELEVAKKLGVDPKKYAARRDAISTKGKKQ